MTLCKFCGETVEQKQFFQHLHEKHPDEMQAIRHQPKKPRKKGAKSSTDDTLTPKPEAETLKTEAAERIRGRFITKVIDLPGDILVLYWLAKAAFPEYNADEGEWIGDCIRQFYAEHSEELSLNKLFDKTYEVIPAELHVSA